VVIAQTVYILQRRQTNRQKNRTELNALPHAGGYTAGVGNKQADSRPKLVGFVWGRQHNDTRRYVSSGSPGGGTDGRSV